jgi:hypothetical protein
MMIKIYIALTLIIFGLATLCDSTDYRFSAYTNKSDFNKGGKVKLIINGNTIGPYNPGPTTKYSGVDKYYFDYSSTNPWMSFEIHIKGTEANDVGISEMCPYVFGNPTSTEEYSGIKLDGNPLRWWKLRAAGVSTFIGDEYELRYMIGNCDDCGGNSNKPLKFKSKWLSCSHPDNG